MDYLLSLVGKDQDTIVDAIKDLAENAEKVKAQELEIKELINKLDEDKEEKHYLKNKLDQKYDMIDDMENELEQMERKCKETKKNLELRETDLKKLEVLIHEQVEEINILRDNNQSLILPIWTQCIHHSIMRIDVRRLMEMTYLSSWSIRGETV